jgi:hypothetical protein
MAENRHSGPVRLAGRWAFSVERRNKLGGRFAPSEVGLFCSEALLRFLADVSRCHQKRA